MEALAIALCVIGLLIPGVNIIFGASVGFTHFGIGGLIAGIAWGYAATCVFAQATK